MISFYSILGAVFSCAVIVILLMLLQRNDEFLKKYGTSTLVFLAVCGFIRMLLPIELTGVTHSVTDRIIPSPLKEVLSQNLFTHSFRTGFFLIWAAGLAVYLSIYTIRYLSTRNRIDRNALPAETHINGILKAIDAACPAEVYVSPDIPVPVITGIHPVRIYLPDYRYPEEDYYYIILHEYTHWKRKDLQKKILLHLLNALLWYNVPAYFLRCECTRLMELGVDQSIADHLDAVEILDYLQAMYDTQYLGSKNQDYLRTGTVAMKLLNLTRRSRSANLQRYHLLISRDSRNQTHDKYHDKIRYRLIVKILFALWLLISYIITL